MSRNEPYPRVPILATHPTATPLTAPLPPKPPPTPNTAQTALRRVHPPPTCDPPNPPPPKNCRSTNPLNAGHPRRPSNQHRHPIPLPPHPTPPPILRISQNLRFSSHSPSHPYPPATPPPSPLPHSLAMPPTHTHQDPCPRQHPPLILWTPSSAPGGPSPCTLYPLPPLTATRLVRARPYHTHLLSQEAPFDVLAIPKPIVPQHARTPSHYLQPDCSRGPNPAMTRHRGVRAFTNRPNHIPPPKPCQPTPFTPLRSRTKANPYSPSPNPPHPP